MQRKILEIKKMLPGIKKNVLLKNFTTFKIGGPAEYFYIAGIKKELIKAVQTAKKLKLPFFILGMGSNVLISDKGFKGLIIKSSLLNFRFEKNMVYAESGVPLSLIIQKAAKHGLGDMSWGVGVPGTIGGAIFGNAGSKENSIKDVVETVEVFDVKEDKLKIFKEKDCNFSYRESVFKNNKDLIILSATLKLKTIAREQIKDCYEKSLKYRQNTQPLNFPSAGSIFKGYIGKIGKKELLNQFPELIDFNKKGIVPAGYLIDKCGLRGKTIGGAQISKMHANFIINTGNAKAGDVIKLIKLIKIAVKKKFGIKLAEEIKFLGFSKNL
ncbi:MAG: UDP-N-acetylmuramate dehydrogenase [Candidatus Parcubacteria bacterium]|nr:UDP-N-acetylmuramate dehydrogenase [Candidatus Parcubacteria bacterium]